MPILEISNLHVNVCDKPILNGVNLEIDAGEVHAIMGPNGSGKSTLSYVLAGREGYDVTEGRIRFHGKNLLAMKPEDRACEGMFLAFQYPVEIPGVPSGTFLKTAVNAIRKYRGEKQYDAMEFLTLVKEKQAELGISPAMMRRPLNVGFSGGEKKRNEVLQMALLEPKLAILDETDSGLDIDALKTVAEGVNKMRRPHRAMIVITHYQRLLEYICPDHVHILSQGEIAHSGGMELVKTLESDGYAGLGIESVRAE